MSERRLGADQTAMDKIYPGYTELPEDLKPIVDKIAVERWIAEGEIPQGDPPVILPSSTDKATTRDNFIAAGRLGIDGAAAVGRKLAEAGATVGREVFNAGKTGLQELTGYPRGRRNRLQVIRGNGTLR